MNDEYGKMDLRGLLPIALTQYIDVKYHLMIKSWFDPCILTSIHYLVFLESIRISY